MGLGVLVIGSNDRGGLPYWYLGSLAETAALAATLPVLILKNSTPLAAVSRQPKLIIAVDVAAPPNTRDLTWLGNLSRSTKSHLSLVYVEPRHRVVIDSLQERKSKDEAKRVLRRLATSLKSKGAAATTISVLPESRSIAHAIVEFAEEEKAWMTVATTPERTRLRRLLLGSNARHILALSKRPFLSLRLE
jgi:nucleotide-binding universal stress UspA family protein